MVDSKLVPRGGELKAAVRVHCSFTDDKWKRRTAEVIHL